MKYFKIFLATMALAGLAACGGGGGSPGGTLNTGSTTTGNATTTSVVSTTGSSQTTTLGAITVDILNGAGASSTSISALEIGQISANVKDASGKPVAGAIVKFSESVSTLLTIAPISATALTDLAGNAVVEFRAASLTSAGATQVNAAVIVSGSLINANKAISISSAPQVVGTSPQLLANALNFLDVVPSDKSIVLAGTGGNGRSESASLRFRVVDKNNSPVKGVAITFSVGAAPVTLNIPATVSDNDGVVVTTISSGSVATPVVVSASVDNRGIVSQSDQLVVTTGLATQRGFDLSATKFNLNFGLTGDLSVITVRVLDENGNKVADGLPVVFTADFGGIASSSRGGCLTLNGSCSVDYTVQNPRPADGQKATVTASTRLGNGTVISGTIQFLVPNLGLVNIFSAPSGGVAVTDIYLRPDCKSTFTLFAGTPAGLPPAAGSTIAVKPLTSNTAVNIIDGGTVLDRLQRRAEFTLEADLTNASLAPSCFPNGLGTTEKTATFKITVSTGVDQKPINVIAHYPTN